MVNAPILSKIGMSAKEKAAMEDVLKLMRANKRPYCVVDMKKLSADHFVIDFKTWNLSYEDGKACYEKLYNKLKQQGFDVERNINIKNPK